MKMKKILLILVLLTLAAVSLTSCSRLIDAVWNLDSSEFSITALEGTAQITLTIPRDDHVTGNKTSAVGQTEKDDYFWGYYIYRNEESPYKDYIMIGIDAQVQTQAVSSGSDPWFWNTGFVEKHGESSTVADSNNTVSEPYKAIYVDSSCKRGYSNYYRVVVVYRKWDKTSHTWKDSTYDKAKSSWTAAKCN